MAVFDYNPFWSFGEAWLPTAARVSWEGWTPDLSKRDERLQWVKDLATGHLVPDEPVPFRQHAGRDWRDWLGSDFFLDLVSEHLVAVLRRHNATGWATFPVRVIARNGAEVSGYHGFAVRSEAQPARDSSQPMIVQPAAAEGRSTSGWRGLYWEPETWDRSDIFRVGGQWVCTERVYESLQSAGLRNVAFERVTDWVRQWPEPLRRHT
jgi:hypothetical protein